MLLGATGLLASLSGCSGVSQVEGYVELGKKAAEYQLSDEKDKAVFHPDDPGWTVYPADPSDPADEILFSDDIGDDVLRRLNESRGADYSAHELSLTLNGTAGSVAAVHSMHMAERDAVGPKGENGEAVGSKYEGTVLSFERIRRFVDVAEFTREELADQTDGRGSELAAERLASKLLGSEERASAIGSDWIQVIGLGIYVDFDRTAESGPVRVFVTLDLLDGINVAGVNDD